MVQARSSFTLYNKLVSYNGRQTDSYALFTNGDNPTTWNASNIIISVHCFDKNH